MKTLFAPGCALNSYKPHLIEKVVRFLNDAGLIDGVYNTCCKKSPGVGATVEAPGTLIVCCPGCAHKFSEVFPGVQIVSLWKVLLETDFAFPFPDYHGRRMTIHDSCHARHRNSSEMQDSARELCRRMNIELVEPPLTRDNSPCCGGCHADFETRCRAALERAAQLPEKDVVVYCTGCTRSFSVTTAVPHHLLDLLFEEKTEGLYPPKP